MVSSIERWRRGLLGLGRLAVWLAALYFVASPWRETGGVIGDRLRWLAWFGIFVGFVVGFALGVIAREYGTGGPGYAGMRRLLYPAMLLAFGASIVLWLREAGPATVAALSTLTAYWAGLDMAFGVAPLLEGRQVGVARPTDTPDASTLRRRGPWVPPWEDV